MITLNCENDWILLSYYENDIFQKLQHFYD